MIIDKMFHSYKARHSVKGSPQKIKIVAPTYLASIASTQINTTALISGKCFGVGIISFTILGSILAECSMTPIKPHKLLYEPYNIIDKNAVIKKIIHHFLMFLQWFCIQELI